MKVKIFGMLLFLSAASVYSQEAAAANKEAAKKEDTFALNARVQSRAVMGQSNSGYAQNSDFDSVDFNFRRIRFSAKYSPAKWVGGVLDLKAENLIKQYSATDNVEIGVIQEANVWFKPGFLGSQIKFGQFKIPFLRENVQSSGKLMLAERAVSSEEALQQQNDIGLLISLKPLEVISPEWENKLVLAFSLTNGDGAGVDGIGRKKGELISSNSSNTKLINWRIEVNPFGGLVKDGKDHGWKEGDEIFQGNSILWSIGAAGSHAQENEYSSIMAQGLAYNGYTFDTTFVAYGAYVNGEFTIFSGDAVPTGGYMSYQATLGYNIKLGSIYLMPLFRYNYVEYDADGSGAIDTSEQENDIWIGANLYAMKHDLKFQLFYRIAGDAAGNTLNKDTLYFEVQTNFGKKI